MISKKQVPWPMTKRLNSLLAWSVWGRCFPLKLYNLVCVLPDSISCYQKLLAFWYCIVFLKVCLISLVMFPCLVHAAFPATVKTGVQESRRLKALSRRLKLSHWHEDQIHLLPTYLCSLRFYFILSSKLKSYVWSLQYYFGSENICLCYENYWWKEWWLRFWLEGSEVNLATNSGQMVIGYLLSVC
jgi:hypothetical protein